MYFKSLEILGFKSFAEKTKLNFEPGVTAIVGPNGCGKSNVADSIRWVLGEQSAKSLRAGSMQDVIFNGTDNKEPINFAEVSLIFSNEKRTLPIDYDEVTITRRIFRSGDTEYLLNRTPVRLKDINELLMGTGIGTESYSIIEQGKMDLILSSKPEDRRYVFEEASGITKYKSKKKEAMRKLEQTEQNLLRINDIIQEVKRQISSIERQARKAERYKVDFDKLKELEVKLSSSEYKTLRTQEATFAVEAQDAKNREKDLSAEVAATSSGISHYRRSLDEANLKISELKRKYGELSNAFDMNEHKVSVDKERIEEARVLQDGLKKEIESAAEKIKSAKEIMLKLKSEHDRAAGVRVEKQASIDAKKLASDNLAKEIEDTENKTKISKVQMVDHLARETRIKNDLIKMGADIQNRRARQRRLETEKASVSDELAGVEKVLEEVVREFTRIESSVSALSEDLESKKRSHASVLAEIKSYEERIVKEENARAAIRSKIEMLEESIRTHEGFGRGVKNILSKHKDGQNLLSGVVGVLADIIKVDRGFEEAVSEFLGDDAQLVVTQSDDDIPRIVEYLRQNNLGRAKFISLETLGRFVQGQPQAAGAPLKDHISADGNHSQAIKNFFSSAYVVDSIDESIRRFDGSSQAVYVTKSGSVFCRGKVSGGSPSDKDSSLLVGRRDRLEDMKSELANIEKSITSMTDARADRSEALTILGSAISSTEDNIHSEELLLAGAGNRKESQESLAAKLREEAELLASELEEATQLIGELTKKGETLNAELNVIENEKAATQAFIEESQVAVMSKKSEISNMALEMASLAAQLAAMQNEEENLSKNLKGQEGVVFELEEALYSREASLKESAERVKAFGEEIAALSSQNEAISKDLLVFESESARLDKAKSDISDKLGIGELQLKEKENSLELLRNQIRDLDVKTTELSYKKANMKERIFNAYKVDLETTHVETEEGCDWDALRSSVAELKERVDKMGPVNLVAIEEHKELEERNSFLIHQQEDLLNAKDSLHKAIQKINKTTKELFVETFQKIQVEFKNFFRMLFGGGQAELVLIDEQDILESGIEIIVRPPGKKLQNIMLLSGGEKALTAIALLFAVFKVKPSPFCVLDEIDAPLDESNVTRFSNVLKDFLKISQFIIITHNKRTIELADVMYGITMQERGVSKIVSVKFSNERREGNDKARTAVVVKQDNPDKPEELKTSDATAASVENAPA
jgi:chromosome segregation protein